MTKISQSFTFLERIISFIFVTNYWLVIASLNIAVERDDNISIFVLILSTSASCMYHSLETFMYDDYGYTIILNEGKWHIIDNIGAICCLTVMISKIYNFKSNYEYRSFYYFILGSAIILQEKGPWKLEHTIFPILLGIVIGIITLIKRGIPKYNKEALIKSILTMAVAFYFFFKGLDDANDYLRIYHSIWHFLGSFGCIYMMLINMP